MEPDAARADDADDRRRARVGFNEIEDLPGNDGQHLRQEPESHLGDAPSPRGAPPSCSLESADSMISANSLPSAPKSAVAMASTPANGPRPTTLIQISAQIRTP